MATVVMGEGRLSQVCLGLRHAIPRRPMCTSLETSSRTFMKGIFPLLVLYEFPESLQINLHAAGSGAER